MKLYRLYKSRLPQKHAPVAFWRLLGKSKKNNEKKRSKPDVRFPFRVLLIALKCQNRSEESNCKNTVILLYCIKVKSGI